MNINIFSAGIWIVSGIALCISAYGQEWRLLSGVLLLDFLFFLPSQVYGAELYKGIREDYRYLGADVSEKRNQYQNGKYGYFISQDFDAASPDECCQSRISEFTATGKRGDKKTFGRDFASAPHTSCQYGILFRAVGR